MSDYEKAIELITSKDNFYINLGLERILKVLDLLDNPQNKLKCIQVAGTNGKGSVCAILESVLRTAGYKTGLYTSPHIWDYTERIQVNGICIPKQKFAEYTKRIVSFDIHLTEFEILTVIMFLYFKDKGVEIAVIETGLGGRLDATNVVKKNLCSIITQIDLDHTDKLGDTKEKIAYEKAGIIKPNCPLITNMDFESIRKKVQENNSKLLNGLKNIPAKYTSALSLKGIHQAENLSLVLAALEYLFPDIQEETIIKGLRSVYHPCRFEYIKEKNLIIDACHNPNGAEALRKNLDLYFPNQKRRYIFGALKRKDYKKMMEILFRSDDVVYLNEFNYPDACTFEELQKACKIKCQKYCNNSIITSDKLNIICGSFYMIGDMKSLRTNLG